MNKFFTKSVFVAAVLMLAGCWGTRYVSADKELEDIYVGKSYYEIEADFGRPSAKIQGGHGGTKIAYNSVTLNGTSAAGLYRQYNVRNRATGRSGMPYGGITFSFDEDMKCYAVQSDFEHERVKEAVVRPEDPQDPNKPNPVKPQIPRTLEFPYVESCSPYANVVTIDRIDVEKDQIKVYFTYRDRTPVHRPVNDMGLYVMPEVYVEDCATRARYSVVSAEGINFYPERTRFAHNDGGYDLLSYALVFEPVAEGTEFINIVEPGHSGFNFYGVDVRTPIKTKDQAR